MRMEGGWGCRVQLPFPASRQPCSHFQPLPPALQRHMHSHFLHLVQLQLPQPWHIHPPNSPADPKLHQHQQATMQQVGRPAPPSQFGTTLPSMHAPLAWALVLALLSQATSCKSPLAHHPGACMDAALACTCHIHPAWHSLPQPALQNPCLGSRG